MLSLETCCCCIPLRVGCLIIGYFYLVGGLIQAILSIINLRAGVQFIGTGSSGGEYLGTILVTCSSITLFLIVLFLIFTLFLIVGLHKDRRGYVKSFLIFYLIFLILWAILFFVSIIIATYNGWYVVLWNIAIGISIYFLLVIKSYYEDTGRVNTVGQFTHPGGR